MASAGPSMGGGGRRRNMDAELNLVPFIDLLSMCICFLLMTAVWMEVGAIDVKQAVGTEASPAATDALELELQFVSPAALTYKIHRPDKSVASFALEGAAPEQMLASLRAQVQALAPTKGAMAKAVSVARLTAKAGVAYGEMVAVMDVLREAGIVNVGVMPAKD